MNLIKINLLERHDNSQRDCEKQKMEEILKREKIKKTATVSSKVDLKRLKALQTEQPGAAFFYS